MKVAGAVSRGGRVQEGDTPSCWRKGGHGKFLNFAYTQRCILVHFQGKKVFVWRSL